jgi:hypothetical protein
MHFVYLINLAIGVGAMTTGTHMKDKIEDYLHISQ